MPNLTEVASYLASANPAAYTLLMNLKSAKTGVQIGEALNQYDTDSTVSD